MQKLQGWVEAGNVLVVVTGTGASSTAKFQGSFPGATVTVYLAGTVTPASIFSDNLSPATVKANPFTAASDGTFFFYAPNGRYDVKFSGGGIAIPFTLGDFSLSDADAFSMSVITVTFAATPTFDASQDSIFQMTLTGNVTSSTISNATTGRVVTFRITQDATGGRTFAWPANVQTPPTVDPTANASTEVTFYYDGIANWWPLFTTPSSVAGGWTDGGAVVRLSTTTDRVSVGDTAVDANIKFEAVGSIRARSAAVVDPTTGAGLEAYYLTASGTGILRAIDWDQAVNKTRPAVMAGRDLSFQTHATTPATLTDRLKITSTGEVLIGIATSDTAIRLDSLGRIRAKSNALSTPTTGAGIEMYFNSAVSAGSLISVDWAAAVNKMQDTLIAGRNISFLIHPTDPSMLAEMFRITSDYAFDYPGQGVVPALSAASHGRIFFNGSKFRVSENGGAYADLVSANASGWQDDGTVVRLITTTDQVAIGSATAIAATVQFSVVKSGGGSALAANAAYSNTAGEYAGYELRRARGTQGTEAAVQTSDVLSRWDAMGWGTSFVAGARIESLARGNWSGTSAPASLTFWTVPSASLVLVERMRITEDGAVQLPNNTPAVSDANTGRLRYISSSQQFEISRNGGTYSRVVACLIGTATLDFANTAAQASADLTIAVTGAAVGDPVALATPAAPNANTCLTAFVSAVDTVTVRFNNYSVGAVDPASASYTVFVFKP